MGDYASNAYIRKERRMQPATTYRAILGQGLSELRQRAGLSQEEFAGRMQITQPTWSRIERGRSAISVEQLIQASKILRVKSSEVIKYVEDSALDLQSRGVRVFAAPPEERKSNDTIQIAAAALGGLLGGLLVSRMSESEE